MTDTKVIPTIRITQQYGMYYYWTLVAFGKIFYLGQDEKFCQRILGMRGSEVVKEMGTSDLRSDEGKQALATFIIEKLELTEEKAASLQEWELSAE